MQFNRIPIFLIFVLVAGFFIDATGALAENGADRTLSPYFFIKSEDPDLDRMPLKSTDVQVNITGVIADVAVNQVYQNEGKKPLEAIYVFPASTKAAVYAMKMTIGPRTIEAKIRKRDEARQEYEQAKKAGQSASLLEQQRPNVFQMNVANILPGDRIKVELKYTELLVPIDKEYEFVYPTVVGPRYIGQEQESSESGSSDWAANPYLQEGELSPNSFGISVRLEAGMPIKKITSSSHKVTISYQNKTTAKVELDRSEMNSANRDFILKYKLAGDTVESSLVLYQGEDENHFLLMVQPPDHVKMKEIPPREYLFVVDVSGSMHGFPLDISKKLLKNLVGSLRPVDRFNVLLFAGGSSVLSEHSMEATQKNIDQAINVIDRQQGSGSTNLLPALKRALDMGAAEGFSRTIVIVTDGYVAVEEDTFELIRNNLGEANIFAFGIGSSVNRHIIEGMARVGFGEPFIITKPQEAAGKAVKFRELIESPVLTDIDVNYGEFGVYDVEPPSIPDVLSERPVIVFGKYRGLPQGKIKLRGLTGSGTFLKVINVTDSKPDQNNSALRYLWARHRIATLDDFNSLRNDDKRITQVTDLGLTYNLLTAYTSFVAIDSKVRLHDGQSVTVKQPLPLPQGVSNYAVGGRSAVSGRMLMKSLPLAPVPGNGIVMQEAAPVKLKEDKSRLPVEKDEEKIVRDDTAIVRIVSINTDSGGFSISAISKIFKEKSREVSRCYLAATTNSIASLASEITLIIEIEADGRIDMLSFDKKTQGKTILTDCFKKVFAGFHFPRPRTGKKERITVVLSWSQESDKR